VVQENNYYPFGAPINDLSWSPKSTNRYLREGKEYVSDFDWNKYDFTGRTFDSWTLRALQVDPMATEYYSTSPYALWVDNPIKFIDPDGRKIKLADNYGMAIANIAQIAATNLGSQVISYLVDRSEIYTMNSTFWSKNSSYDPSDREINYVANPWYNTIPYDGGALTSMIAMGHETFHAFDHSNNVFNANNTEYSKSIVEPRAVSFANYLRQAYSLSPLREKYGNIQGNFHQFAGSDRISNFTTLGNNADETSYGFSYTKTTTTVLSYFGNTNIPNKTKTETATYYMTVNMDKDKNITYQIYTNEADYKKAISNW
jgi:RHS repeat-associated protein